MRNLAYKSIAALGCKPVGNARRSGALDGRFRTEEAVARESSLGLMSSASRRNYSVATTDDDAIWVMPAFAAAITVPSMITPQRIAAKMKPAVFMFIPLTRNTNRGTVRYAKKSPCPLGDYAALAIRSFASGWLAAPLGVPWRTSVAKPSFSSARMTT